jgi:hypothetical protein
MSDAPAAPVTENGVPPVTQEKVEETPGFKVVFPAISKANSLILPLILRSSPATLRTPLRMKG